MYLFAYGRLVLTEKSIFSPNIPKIWHWTGVNRSPNFKFLNFFSCKAGFQMGLKYS